VALAAPAVGQAQAGVSLDAGATTDARRRGLSWSGGRASVNAGASAEIAGVEARGRVTALRGSTRHGNADLVADASLGVSRAFGGANVRLGATGHFFAGAVGRLDYGELDLDADYTLGPVQLVAGASFAPAQRAVGGSNLYVFAGANMGIPATPVTLSAGIGRTSGPDGRARSDRLRPGGDYTDWRIGADYVAGRLTLGLDYTDTDLGGRPVFAPGDGKNSGARVLARISYGL
jgi:hypothetical protein